jgi:two-component system, cell cycle sensor histidine kinase and response regulator CckA
MARQPPARKQNFGLLGGPWQSIPCRDDKTFMSQTTDARPGPESSALIFVVDDNTLLLEFAGTVLKDEGYEIRPFTNPKAALEAMQEADPKPVALLTDYEMVEMNGLQLIALSYEIHPSLKTVLMSGTITEAFIAGHPAKVHRFLGKPYRSAQLKNMVGELLQS